MAARRLLIIMVILLTISTLAAALVPAPQQRAGSSSTSSTTSTEKSTSQEPEPGSELIRAEVPAERDRKRPREIDLLPGDQLALVVTSGRAGEASVPDFGLIEFAGPGDPARFDVLVDEAGKYPVRFQGAGEVATIVARTPGNSPQS
jgi:hypothetical protein